MVWYLYTIVRNDFTEKVIEYMLERNLRIITFFDLRRVLSKFDPHKVDVVSITAMFYYDYSHDTTYRHVSAET